MIMKGCRWRPSDRSRGSRISGKNEIHRRLQIDEFTEEPRLVFFNNCTNIVAQLPSIPLDKKNPEDIETLIHIILLSRNFERAGDHIVNIARQVHQIVTGEDLKASS